MFSVKRHQPVFLVLLLLVVTSAFALNPKTCPVGVPVGTFKITVVPATGGTPIPLSAINIVGPGEKLRYEPIKISPDAEEKTRVSLILVPAGDNGEKHLAILAPQLASKAAEWTIYERVSAVGVVFGPHGIDTRRVASLVDKHPEIVTKLADYAAQTSRVEAMIQTLSDYEESAPGSVGLQSVLQGFSSQYGVQMPTFDSSSGSSQQALALVRALAPAVAKNDPIPDRSSLMTKTGGLAGSLAASYFGAPVALAIGGAQLAGNLRTALFPPTDFRSAFAERDGDGTRLCTAKPTDNKTRVRLDYLWMSRIPNEDAPLADLVNEAHVPVGASSTITVRTKTVSQLKDLSRARDWELVAPGHRLTVPVKVQSGTDNDKLTVDLSHTRVPPGEYQLAAKWDWTPFSIAGTLDVRSPGNMRLAKQTPDSQDALIAGAGEVPLHFMGTDFEFVNSVSLAPADSRQARNTAPVPVSFTLPKGQAKGEQTTMDAVIDTTTLTPGHYLLAVKQANGSTEDIAIKVHPPNPQITPDIRVNLGEPQQTVELHGKGLERIEKISSELATWTLEPAQTDGVTRRATVKLNPTAQKGDKIAAEVYVRELHAPLHVADLLHVAGPRPRIVSSSKSLAGQTGIELHNGEIPAGQATSFSMQVQHAGEHPTVALSCNHDDDTRHRLTLAPGDKDGSAQLDLTGEGTLFLSVDPGVVGDSGCELIAQVTDTDTGTSDPYALGEVIRLPHLEKLAISDQRLAENTYAGTLTGENLQLIAKAGWNNTSGDAVLAIPTADPENPREQTLKIAVPWPPPAPQAPLYVWLRGETQARRTDARY